MEKTPGSTIKTVCNNGSLLEAKYMVKVCCSWSTVSSIKRNPQPPLCLDMYSLSMLLLTLKHLKEQVGFKSKFPTGSNHFNIPAVYC